MHDEPEASAYRLVESKDTSVEARFSAADTFRSRGFLRSTEAVRFPEQSTSSVQPVPPQSRRRADSRFRRSEKTRNLQNIVLTFLDGFW